LAIGKGQLAKEEKLNAKSIKLKEKIKKLAIGLAISDESSRQSRWQLKKSKFFSSRPKVKYPGRRRLCRRRNMLAGSACSQVQSKIKS